MTRLYTWFELSLRYLIIASRGSETDINGNSDKFEGFQDP